MIRRFFPPAVLFVCLLVMPLSGEECEGPAITSLVPTVSGTGITYVDIYHNDKVGYFHTTWNGVKRTYEFFNHPTRPNPFRVDIDTACLAGAAPLLVEA